MNLTFKPVPVTVTVTATNLPATVTITPTVPVPTLTTIPTATPFPLPTANPTLVACTKRKPAPDDLLVVVTEEFGLSPDYIPRDLIRLDKYLPASVVYSSQIKVRSVMVAPLVQMIKAMQTAGLKPIIRSGYRSYYHQADTYASWVQKLPDRAGYISAQPGHSEHQLGLAVDFGSPELAALVGDQGVEFHTDFDKTHESRWLTEHSQEYGFTMSYPVNAIAWTGLAYEPWHFRYVGKELATYLYETSQFLIEFLMQARPFLPCMVGT